MRGRAKSAQRSERRLHFWEDRQEPIPGYDRLFSACLQRTRLASRDAARALPPRPLLYGSRDASKSGP
jgi:hypothetical protein